MPICGIACKVQRLSASECAGTGLRMRGFRKVCTSTGIDRIDRKRKIKSKFSEKKYADLSVFKRKRIYHTV